jgi:iron-sulfur cluster repair protein YtfE (RIC family)
VQFGERLYLAPSALDLSRSPQRSQVVSVVPWRATLRRIKDTPGRRRQTRSCPYASIGGGKEGRWAMETFSHFYAHDHDRLDNLFEEYTSLKTTDGNRAGQRFREFTLGLERHMAWEEGLLFPLWEAKTGIRETGPTAVMRREHQQIREFLSRMGAALEAGTMPTAEDDSGLAAIVAVHNKKEELMLYPMIDRQSTVEERQQVFSNMEGKMS